MDDQNQAVEPEPEVEMTNRRDLLKWLVATVCVLPTAGLGVGMMISYLLPKVVLHEERFWLAKVSEITKAGLEAKVKGTSFIVVRQGDKVRAFSTICTHLGCKVLWKSELPGFHCPCHEGYFDADGEVTAGPPPQALPEYPVDIERDDIYIRLVIS